MNNRTIIFAFCLFFFFAVELIAQFKFAHVTDTHVGSETGANDLRNTVNDLNRMTDIKFVLITGDITEFGSDSQLRLAKQILDSLTIPWYIIPGNHDMKWSESAGTSFAKIFGYERFVFDFDGYKFIGLHQGPRMRMGDAYWSPEDIQWTDSVLNSISDKRQRLIVATHYPADSGIANYSELTTKFREYNTQALLNGHWHSNSHGVF
jgi:3',5'-cyclic AMP phosphodiesterase CpdA